MTALHLAAIAGYSARVRWLLDGGWNPRARDRWGRAPLHLALIREKEAAAELLADADCITDILDHNGFAPIHWAACCGFVGVIRKLLAAGAETLSRNEVFSPIRLALEFKQETAAELLLDADCITDTQNVIKEPLLHLAVRLGYLGVIEKLLTAGADTRLINKGYTPLHVALTEEKEAAAELLADADCITDILDEDGLAPIHWAAMRGFVGVIRKLLAAGADTRFGSEGGSNTPIRLAIECEQETAVELLLKADSFTEFRNSAGETSLHHAAGVGYLGIIEKLLAAGADTRAKDDRGCTPLHIALFRGGTEAVAELLVGADGEIDSLDSLGCTPLYRAAECGYVGVVRKLLWSGARLDSAGVDRDPLQYAAFNRNDDLAEAILAWCALWDVAVNWAEMKLSQDDTQRCIELLSRCDAEVWRMKDARIPGLWWSYWHVLRGHVSRLSRCLEDGAVREALKRGFADFPIYRDWIAFVMGEADKWSTLAPHWLKCFSFVACELPPTCTDLVLLHLSERDLRHFIRACE
ncbi:ankyrin repeat and protein kinase domain-containing protein 1-like [Uloborus diversus]|uniref:ankyrin repeat and protein kinase domain-containing protein 1-like n=1 Tax=Uloborus diversus TaxID=327109 RepID=UPI002409D4F9|nr:ankyrin repeat and protein kinase domain-containing protein 1-like [Uloborus diversus]